MVKMSTVLEISILICLVVVLVPVYAAGACPPVTASVQGVRHWVADDHTRIVVDLDSHAEYRGSRLTSPDRIYFDIANSKLSSGLPDRVIPVKGVLVKQVRLAQNRPDVVRVVLDVSATADYILSELPNPSRIVIDVRGKHAPDSIKPSSNPRPEEVPGYAVSAPVPADVPVVPEIVQSQIQLNASAINAVALGSGSGQPASSESMAPETTGPLSPTPLYGIMIVKPTAAIQANKKAKPAKAKVIDSSSEHLRPFAIVGTLYSGYYSSFTRGGGNGNGRISFVPAGATFDVNGYYMTPDVVDYTIQTRFNAGPQASDAGFEGGNGVQTRITTLRKGAFPLTFRYSNVQLKDAYFGSLTQVSSYTQNNRNKDLGMTLGLNVAGLPAATADWGVGSVHSQSLSSVIPDYNARSNHLNLNCSDQRWGWDIQCFAGRQQQESDLFARLAEDPGSLLRQKVTQYRASARRSFLGDSELYVDGGRQSTSNIVLNQPVDLTTRYASANLRIFQRRKWKTSLHAGYTSNIAGLVLAQMVGGLGSNGSIAPDANVVQSLRRSTSYLNLGGLTSVDLPYGLGMYGSVDRTAVLTAAGSDLSSSYLTTAGGVTYSRSFGWGSLSGQYGRSIGKGSITGQTGRIAGQNYLFSAQPGKPDGLQFDFTVRGSDQSIRNEMPAREHRFASDVGVGLRVFGPFRARLGGGWQRSVFSNLGNEFRTRGYTARAGIEHPRFQLNGSLDSSIGNSLQSYSQIFTGIGVESTLLTPLRLVPSDLRGLTVTLHVIPIRKLELSALFTHSVQHLEGIVANDFEVIDVYLTFHFRKLQFVAGYFSSTQTYSSYLAIYPETQRGRFYIRISRPAKFL